MGSLALSSSGSSRTAANLRPCGIPAMRHHREVAFERDVDLICPTAGQTPFLDSVPYPIGFLNQ